MDLSAAECQSCVLTCSLRPKMRATMRLRHTEKEHGTIWIKIHRESGGVIVLKVEDDGAGMSRERMEQLNEWMSRKERDENIDAFGSLNVNDRIRMAYGDEFGLYYTMREGGGVIACLKVKAER